jgi:hypothetical protein
MVTSRTKKQKKDQNWNKLLGNGFEMLRHVQDTSIKKQRRNLSKLTISNWLGTSKFRYDDNW